MNMKLTKGQQALVDQARAAGYTIEASDKSVDIFKKSGRAISLGIRLCEDSTAYRIDVELGSALLLRSQKQMKEVLGLK